MLCRLWASPCGRGFWRHRAVPAPRRCLPAFPLDDKGSIQCNPLLSSEPSSEMFEKNLSTLFSKAKIVNLDSFGS